MAEPSTRNHPQNTDAKPDSPESVPEPAETLDLTLIDALSTHVYEVFSELARVQDELRTKLEVVCRRETRVQTAEQDVQATRSSLQEKARSLEEKEKDLERREAELAKREASAARREEIFLKRKESAERAALQGREIARRIETLKRCAQMTANIRARVRDLTGLLQNAEPAAIEREASQPGNKLTHKDNTLFEGVDVSDFTPEERRRLEMLRSLGTATVAEIVDTIRADRATVAENERKNAKPRGSRRL